jgi:hypothetical protein
MYFYVLLYYCHRANTQLQLNKYIYIYIICPLFDFNDTRRRELKSYEYYRVVHLLIFLLRPILFVSPNTFWGISLQILILKEHWLL